MRRLIVTEFITLDGVVEAPGGGEAFEHGGWNFKYWSDDVGAYKLDELKASDTHLYGRVTYEAFAASWPNMTELGEFADLMNGTPKVVVSTTLKEAVWTNSRLLRDNVAAEIAQLKQQPGQDILVAGSPTLVETLRQHNLVDEYRLLVHPIVLGHGQRLFADGRIPPTELKLVDTKQFDGGILALTLVPAPAAPPAA
jgi:dihydrofolate reductase